VIATREIKVFTPGLEASDPQANHWLRQVMLRLRREICWMWQERTGQPGERSMPPLVDRVSESLDRARYWEQKQHFFASDPTARYLSEQIAIVPPRIKGSLQRGSLAWVAEQADLDPVAIFVLSLALIARFDSASGAVISACHNDANRTSPTLALAQKLWDAPEQVLGLSDPSHALYRFGLLRRPDTNSSLTEWDAPLSVPEILVKRLLFPEDPFPSQLSFVGANDRCPTTLNEIIGRNASQLNALPAEMRIVPLLVAPGASARDLVGAISEQTGRPVLNLQPPISGQNVYSSLLLCWLGASIFFFRPAHSKAHQS
jgi:hypothetical protein